MISKQQREEGLGFFVIDYSVGGGVERVTADLMQKFKYKGFKNLHLISLRSENKTPLIKYPEGIAIEVLDKEQSGTMNICHQLGGYLNHHQIKHLIFQGDNMTITLEVLKGAKIAGCKAYPQYHGSPYAYLRKYADAKSSNIEKKIFSKIVFPFKKAKLKKVIQNSEHGFYCVSNGAKRELMDLYKGNEGVLSKLKVIRNPIIFDTCAPQEKQKLISFVSRLESKHKNAFLAIKAWSLIAKKYPDWKLMILGDGSLKHEMEGYCKDHRMENVEFPGFVNNVRDILQKSAISLNVSNCEGFPMGVAEAIAAKNALVVTDSDGGARDMIIHKQTGLVAAKNDAAGLAGHIEQLIMDENLRNQLAENAFRNLQKLAERDTFTMWIKELFG